MLGISFDSPEDNKKFVQKFSYPMQLLSDPDRKIGLAYGAAKTATDGYAKRLTFVIDQKGTIGHVIDTKDPGGQAAALLKEI